MSDKYPWPGDVRIVARKPGSAEQVLSRTVRKRDVQSALHYLRSGGGKALYLIRLKAWK